jgi:uncharacterized membrane protein
MIQPTPWHWLNGPNWLNGPCWLNGPSSRVRPRFAGMAAGVSDAGLRKRLSHWSDTLRTELWPLPTACVAAAVVAGIALPRLDARVDRELPDWLTAHLFTGGPGAARTVLEAIASSLITVTSLTFSLTVVTLQLASSQFSPRLLRTFTRDRFVHVTLGIFLATFAYSLTVLRTVRTAEDGQDAQDAFVPQISVTLAFAAALASVTFLVLFLGHLARQIRVETMLHDVHADASASARSVTGGLIGSLADGSAGGSADGSAGDDRSDARRLPRCPRPPLTASPVLAGDSGFLVRVDEEQLLAAAQDAAASVWINRSPGAYVVRDTPIGLLWAEPDSQFDDEVRDRLLRRVSACILVGHERTPAQDAAFGLRQLTDVAVKALSPGINDPTTAIHALGHCSALLCELAQADLGPALLGDENGQIRVIVQRPDLAELLDNAIAQPRRYGAGDPAVLGRLLWLLRELAWRTSQPAHHQAIRSQLERLQLVISGQDFDGAEQADLAELGTMVQRALGGHWPAPPTPESP